jgi:hypothetical protein
MSGEVYVVVCDCGLNGAWLEAVCSDRVEAQVIADKVNQCGRSLSDHPGDPNYGRYTGFSGAEGWEAVMDGEVKQP